MPRHPGGEDPHPGLRAALPGLHRRRPRRTPEDCGGPQAFLALRPAHSPYAVAVGLAELLAPLLDGADEDTLRGHLAEHREEMAGLLAWSRIDEWDRPAVNHALHTHPGLGGSPA